MDPLDGSEACEGVEMESGGREQTCHFCRGKVYRRMQRTLTWDYSLKERETRFEYGFDETRAQEDIRGSVRCGDTIDGGTEFHLAQINHRTYKCAEGSIMARRPPNFDTVSAWG